MKKIIINVLMYVIFFELVFIGVWKVAEGLDNCPIYQYQTKIENK